MVERLDLDQRQRLLERLREELVGAARLRDARWMVVSENDARSVVSQRRLHDFPRVDARLRERAAKQFFRTQHPVLRLQQKRNKDSMSTPAERQLHDLEHPARPGPRI